MRMHFQLATVIVLPLSQTAYVCCKLLHNYSKYYVSHIVLLILLLFAQYMLL